MLWLHKRSIVFGGDKGLFLFPRTKSRFLDLEKSVAGIKTNTQDSVFTLGPEKVYLFYDQF
jgi:hypothetical protein